MIHRSRHRAPWLVLVVAALGCPPEKTNTSATLTEPGTTSTGETATTGSSSSSTSTATEPDTTAGASTGSTTGAPETFHCGPPDGGIDCPVGQICVDDSFGSDVEMCPMDLLYCIALPVGCTEDDPCAPACGDLCGNSNCPVSHFLCGGEFMRCDYRCDEQATCKVPDTACKAVKSTAESGWKTNHCVPSTNTGAKPGEPCALQDGGDYWYDTCEPGAICWPVDADTMQGVCKPQCALDDSPACDTCLVLSDQFEPGPEVAVCVAACDPLMSDCPAGELCVVYDTVGEGFVCLPAASDGTAASFGPCEAVNGCDPGLTCEAPFLAPDSCDVQAAGCCLPLCDTTMPQCPGELGCQSWYGPGEAPPGLEDVGVCRVP